MNKSLIRKIIRESLIAETRADKSKSAVAVREILLSNLDPSWAVAYEAPPHSNKIDLVLGKSDGKTPPGFTDKVNVEVKDYSSQEKQPMTLFKAEISLKEIEEIAGEEEEGYDPASPQTRTKKSRLASLTGLGRGSFSATAAGVRARILDPMGPDDENEAAILNKIKRVLSRENEASLSNPKVPADENFPLGAYGKKSEKRWGGGSSYTEYIGVARITKGCEGKDCSRKIFVAPGEIGDYSRVKHQSHEDPGSKRDMFTVGVGSVKKQGELTVKENEVKDDLATAIKADFEHDVYLGLYDGGSRVRIFTLGKSPRDPLGFGAPEFTGSDIESWKYGTHGGGVRPAVEVTVKKTSGLTLSGKGPGPKSSKGQVFATQTGAEKYTLKTDVLERDVRQLIREILLQKDQL